MRTLGEGQTSKVYLGEAKTGKRVAIKVIRDEYLKTYSDGRADIVNEVVSLQSMEHDNIIKCLEYGSKGIIKKPDGAERKDVLYIVLEFAEGGLLFDVAQLLEGFEEEMARYFYK